MCESLTQLNGSLIFYMIVTEKIIFIYNMNFIITINPIQNFEDFINLQNFYLTN